jgi:hypothetical protein
MNRPDIIDKTFCDSDVYPMSGLPKIPFTVSGTLEIISLVILLGYTYFRRLFRVLTKAAIF